MPPVIRTKNIQTFHHEYVKLIEKKIGERKGKKDILRVFVPTKLESFNEILITSAIYTRSNYL